MPETKPLDLASRIDAEVELALEPYVGKTTPVVLRKMRELAYRYFTEHPQAVRILEVLDRNHQVRSGEVIKRQPGGVGAAGGATVSPKTKMRKV